MEFGPGCPNPNVLPLHKIPYQSQVRCKKAAIGFEGRKVRRIFSGKRKFLTKVLQSGLAFFLLATIMMNVTFILERTKATTESGYGSIGLAGGESRTGNSIRSQELRPKSINIEVVSSRTRVAISVDEATIVESGEDRGGRGIHVLILHQGTGAVMARRVFDTYSPHEDDALVFFVNMVSEGRIVVLAIKDEGTFQMRKTTREVLQRLGSKKAMELNWRDMWAFVAVKGSRVFGEQISKSPEFNSWGAPVLLRVEVPLVQLEETECDWPDTEENRRRRQFCGHIEGYGSLCSCRDPAPLVFTVEPLLNNQVYGIPVAIIASNRPHYLYRCLRSLLTAPGVNPDMVTVFIDGYYEEPLAVAKLFGLRGVQHTPLGVKNGRIAQHYKSSLTSTFNIFPSAKHVIVLEEDLDVAPDFFSYFSQTLYLLEEDQSLFCISAWNDHGYEHSSADPALLYRVESMPGLGWLLKRQIYKEEFEPQWPTPEKMWDWDMWMRLPEVRKDRECVIPDVPRTYHFGAFGLNMNSFFQEAYFKKHALNDLANVPLKDIDNLKSSSYEGLVRGLLSKAVVLDHSKDPCEADFIPESLAGRSAVVFIEMVHRKDFKTWLQMAKCFGLWDLDGRGLHKGMWRFHLKSNPIFVVGVPYSDYSVFKPSSVVPLKLEAKPKRQKRRRKRIER